MTDEKNNMDLEFSGHVWFGLVWVEIKSAVVNMRVLRLMREVDLPSGHLCRDDRRDLVYQQTSWTPLACFT